ncbi:MAG: DUF72 domain-containing protein [Candidatus Caldarchaeum sp.]
MAGEVLIGAGGWQYFIIPGRNSLREYSKAFDFVEVNSTFYKKVPLSQCMSWRSTVDEKFVFTVKCHRHVTHVYGLRAVEQCFKAFEHCVDVCRVLHAPLLVLETPPTLSITSMLLTTFFSSVDCDGVKVGLEARGPVAAESFKTMMDIGIIHVTDISREMPKYYDEGITYSRLFGRGVHNMYQFDDSEVVEINTKAENTPSKRVFLSFHGIRMYVDAARLKVYRNTGQMAPVTSSTGVESFAEVMDDAVFPASKQHLIDRHGWKLFDKTRRQRARVSEILAKIPDRTYQNLNELVDAVRNIMP